MKLFIIMEVWTKYLYFLISIEKSIEIEKVNDLIEFRKHENKTSYCKIEPG